MKPIGGYCWAITVAVLCCTLWTTVSTWTGGFESATGLPVSTALSHLLVMMTLDFFILWPIVFCMAMPPFLAAIFVADKFQIESFFYFAICGGVIGLIAAPLFVYFRPRFLDITDPTFLEEFLHAALPQIFYGASGGIAYWWKHYRHSAIVSQRL